MHKYSVSWNAQVVPIVMCGTLAKTRDFCHKQKTWPWEVRFLVLLYGYLLQAKE